MNSQRTHAPARARLGLTVLVIASLLATLSLGAIGVSRAQAGATIDHLVWSPKPIAPTGSLAPEIDTKFTVRAYDSSNTVIPGVPIYLTYAGRFASNGTGVFAGSCGGESSGAVTLSATPVRCVSDATTGALELNFFSGFTLPNGGTETFTAAVDAGGSLATSDTYTYATIDHLVWTPKPIAPTGSLPPETDTKFAVTAYDSSNAVIPGTVIYVTYSGRFTTVNIGVFAGHCDGETSGNSIDLSATPVRCVTDLSTGALLLNFYSGSPLPNGGTETFTAAVDTGGSLATSDTYTYATIDHLVWTPKPIAPTGSLPPETDTKFAVTAYDSSNAVIPGTVIYVTYSGRFTTVNIGVFAGHCDGETSGSIDLSATPVRCVTDLSTGALLLNFYSGSPLPNGGTETFTAAVDTGGSLATSDTYTYATIDHLVWTPKPIAPTDTLPASTDVHFNVKAYDAGGSVIPGVALYLAYSGIYASRSTGVFAGHCDGETSGSIDLSATPVRCVTDLSSGALDFNFYSGSPLPAGGTETFTAAVDTSGSLAVTDTYTYVAPPTITKSFSPTSISVNGSSTLSFTIRNPNPTTTLAGVAFGDTLPAGLVVRIPNGLTGSCGGGTISAPAGGSTISLAGATLAASASCTFSVKVTGQSAGVMENTTDPVTSTNGGDGNAASATLTVLAPDLAISKHHSPGTFHVGQPGVYTIHVSNLGPGATSGSVTVVDTLPLGLPPVSVAGSGWSCAISKIVKATCTRSNSLAAGASYPDITLIVRPTISALGTFLNIAQVSDANDANPANNSAIDPTVTGF